MTFNFLEQDFWANPLLVIVVTSSFAVITFLRYFISSYLYKVVLEQLTGNIRNSIRKNSSHISRDIKWSILSSLVFAAVFAFCLFCYHAGWTKIYIHVNTFSIFYLLISPAIYLLLYETYYYWLHRWMHSKPVFNTVHKVHHQSINPTVFSAFAFHPLEALLQFSFFPIALACIPIHLSMLGAVFALLTFTAMINHGGFELYPKTLRKHVIGSRHHDLHHLEFKSNFGLLFTWWDKLMKTESKKSRS